jgi:hypothetical protein
MDDIRKAWNKRQTRLRQMLSSREQFQEAVELFMMQHAMVHTAAVAQQGLPSFEDEVLGDMTEERIRRVPSSEAHSAAWLLWHMARIEDVTMNVLVAGESQIFGRDGWHERLGIVVRDTGNATGERAIVELSQAIDIESLRAYRQAVGHRTREIVTQLRPEQLKEKVDPGRLQRLLDEGAVLPEAQGLIDYWSRRTIAGLLLMPPTRHNFIHLNEAQRVKRRK